MGAKASTPFVPASVWDGRTRRRYFQQSPLRLPPGSSHLSRSGLVCLSHWNHIGCFCWISFRESWRDANARNGCFYGCSKP